MSIKVDVITPEKLVFSKEVDFIAAPATDGEVGILPGHAPLLTSLGFGELRLKLGSETENLAITGGFLEVKEGNHVAIFAETAEMTGEIDVERAKLAAERAKTKISQSKDITPEEMARLQAAMSRALFRLKLGQQRKGHKPPPGMH